MTLSAEAVFAAGALAGTALFAAIDWVKERRARRPGPETPDQRRARALEEAGLENLRLENRRLRQLIRNDERGF
ncbi:MAG: hypothetical protein C0501_21275 [Isosphaera sp.]|nr:hypothetical protein [Isosphaera sp.]